MRYNRRNIFEVIFFHVGWFLLGNLIVFSVTNILEIFEKNKSLEVRNKYLIFP